MFGSSETASKSRLQTSAFTQSRKRVYTLLQWPARAAVAGGLFVAGGDTAEVFELVEEALDEVAMAVEVRIDRALDLAVAAGRDVEAPAGGLDEVEDGAGVVAPVGDDIAARHALDEGRHRSLVAGLSGQEHDADGQPAAVDARVDLGAQSPRKRPTA
ncbi:MAG TPA: hypothetical protein VF601_10650 [Beijerinckiaceae bacterium]|jgi:hypothetical protein